MVPEAKPAKKIQKGIASLVYHFKFYKYKFKQIAPQG